jgi:hypothetical protein
MLLRLADLADQVLAIDGVALLNLEGGHLSTVWGGDYHFLVIELARHSSVYQRKEQ